MKKQSSTAFNLDFDLDTEPKKPIPMAFGIKQERDL
jgi:hypothetical protein